ncbi:MAG TPA: flagellar hook-length control protein FliK [Planctomycetota bacterium]|nr:flagellar hook-length control protein FliK [Planctomycetota bacterium]
MELLPGLRPTGPTLERATAVRHERDVTESTGDARGFDEQLDEVSGRRAAAEKADGASRAEESASRARPAAEESLESRRLEKTPAKEHEKSEPPAAEAPAVDQPRAGRAKASVRPESPQPESAQAAEGTPPSGIAVAANPEVVASSDGLEDAASPASSPATPTVVDASAIAAASNVQAPATSAPATLAADLGAATPEAPAVESSPSKTPTAQEPALLAPKLDTTASAPTSATPAGADLPHDFERELALVRETADPRALHTARAHANDSAAEILRQVRVGLSADLREANIHLAPESLGRVSIRLRVEHGALTADVRAESVQALRALELHAPELKAALAGHAAETRTLELSFSLMNSHTGDGPGRGQDSRSDSPRASHHRFDLTPVQVEHALARRLSTSGVDTYA